MADAPLQESFFRLSGAGDSMWEIGRAQSTVVKLVEQGLFHGDMLDIGCGIGDNTIYIAEHVKDLRLTAIDLVIPCCISRHDFHLPFKRFPKPLASLEKKLRPTTSRFNSKW